MTNISPLAGKAGFWLRQYSDTSEGTTGKILDTLTGLGGGNLLVLKCADGMSFQGDIDASTPAHSVADIAFLKAACEARGVTFCPVVCPRGGNSIAEPLLHAQIARAAGVLMVDLEPYTDFWDRAPLSAIPAYCSSLSANAAGAYLVLQPDPRPYAFTAINVPALAGYFDAFCPQHYVGWDSGTVHWLDVDTEVARFEQFRALGRDMFVTLYGVDRTDLAAQFWEHVKGEALGFHVFSLGPMNADQLKVFAGLPRPQIPAPIPVPQQPSPDPCAAITARVQTLEQQNAALTLAVGVAKLALGEDYSGIQSALDSLKKAMGG